VHGVLLLSCEAGRAGARRTYDVEANEVCVASLFVGDALVAKGSLLAVELPLLSFALQLVQLA
jgi:hypothetical protein